MLQYIIPSFRIIFHPLFPALTDEILERVLQRFVMDVGIHPTTDFPYQIPPPDSRDRLDPTRRQ